MGASQLAKPRQPDRLNVSRPVFPQWLATHRARIRSAKGSLPRIQPGRDSEQGDRGDWVKDRQNTKGEWHPIGVVWAHADGWGFNVALDLQFRDGRVTLRVLEEKAD